MKPKTYTLSETLARVSGERKMTKSLLIEAKNEANNRLLASFSTKSSEILAVFTRHLIRAKVSIYLSKCESGAKAFIFSHPFLLIFELMYFSPSLVTQRHLSCAHLFFLKPFVRRYFQVLA